MQPTGNPYLDAYSTQGGGGGAAAPAAPAGGGGHGLLGGLYDTFIKPAVSTVAGLPSDLYHGITAAGIGAGSIARGEHGSVAASTKQRALDEMRKAAGYGQFFKPDVASQQANTGKTLEGVGGKTVSNVANLEAFNPALAGANAGSVMKIGAGLGAAQGVGSAMQQGGSAGDVVGAGLGGGLAGAATAGALHGAGVLGSKVLGRGGVPAVAGAKRDLVGGNVAKNATKAGEIKGQNLAAQQQDEAGFNLPGAQKGIRRATSFDKNGNVVSLQPTTEALRAVGMSPESVGPDGAAFGGALDQNMQAFHDLSLQAINKHMSNATEGIKVDGSGAMQLGSTAIQDAELGKFSKNGQTGAANETRRNLQSALDGVGSSATVEQVLGAVSKLDAYRSGLAEAAQAGLPQAIKQRGVYQTVMDHLDELLNSQNVDHAIANHQLGIDEQNALRADIINGGGSHGLADSLINAINNGKSFAELRSAKQPAVVAGNLARVARRAQAEAPTEAFSQGGQGMRNALVEGAIALKHPGYMPFFLANAAKQGSAGVKGAIAKRLAPGSFQAGMDQALAPSETVANKFDTSAPEQVATTGAANIGFQGETPTIPVPVGRQETTTTQDLVGPTRASIPMGGGQPSLKVNNPLAAPLGGARSRLAENTQTQRVTNIPPPSGATPTLHGMTTPERIPTEAPPLPPAEAPVAPSGGQRMAPAALGLMAGLRNNLAGQAGAATAASPAPQQQAAAVVDTGTSTAGMSQPQQSSPYSLQNLQADIQRDPKNASTYMDIYKTFNSASAAPKATAAQIASAQAITDGYAALNSASDQLAGMGGTGPKNAGGKLPLIGGYINSNVAAYEKTRIDLATALAKALTGRSAVPHSLITQYMNSIPDATTPPAQAAQQMANLQNQLDQRAQQEAVLNPAAAQLVGGQ